MGGRVARRAGAGAVRAAQGGEAVHDDRAAGNERLQEGLFLYVYYISDPQFNLRLIIYTYIHTHVNNVPT